MASLNYNVSPSEMQGFYKETKWQAIVSEFLASPRDYAEVVLTDEYANHPESEWPKIRGARVAALKNYVTKHKLRIVVKNESGRVFVIKKSWLEEKFGG